MKDRMVTMLMLAGALGASGAAAYFANGYIERTIGQRRAEIESQYQPLRVIVANADLQPGAVLSGQTVAVREMPRAFVHSQAVSADDWSGIAGRVLAYPLKSGESVLLSHLARDAGAGFSAQLASGMRALTIPVDAEASISGMLAPGDRIDILWTASTGKESITLPLLYNVPVLATGIRTATNAGWLDTQRQSYNVGAQFSTATIAVSPEDAAKITLAQQAGRITLTLRRPGDDGALQLTRITKDSLLRDPRVARTKATRARIEIIVGGA
jgi:pilus assembly protein CpaB